MQETCRKVDVRLCHACHAQCRGVTRDHGAPKPDPSAPPSAMSATPATQNDTGCEIVPRLPRKTLVDVRLCHACHVKRKWMSPSATPATHNAAASRATRARLNQAQARHPVPWVPRLPHKTMVGATPATQNACGCEIVPRLPRETKVDVTKCHACRTVPRRHARPGRA